MPTPDPAVLATVQRAVALLLGLPPDSPRVIRHARLMVRLLPLMDQAPPQWRGTFIVECRGADQPRISRMVHEYDPPDPPGLDNSERSVVG